MSRENVEIVREAFAALGRADLGTLRKLANPDVEWHDQWELPGSTAHVGIEALLSHISTVLDDLTEVSVDLEELEELADGRLLASYRIQGVGRASGVPVKRPAVAITLRTRKFVRAQIFGSRAYALKAVGLAE